MAAIQMMPGSIEWMRAGRGMWHGGGVNAGRMLGFQLWIALPPELELSDPESIYIDADEIKSSGPARVLFGEYAGAKSRIPASMAINYLAVKLQTGESWRYQPPPHHSVLWIAVASGSLAHSESICADELIIFEPLRPYRDFHSEYGRRVRFGFGSPARASIGYRKLLRPYVASRSKSRRSRNSRNRE
jgi:redox-sensitive bicupin YhaK (pirin superfamily)